MGLWLRKGGFVLELRLAERARSTKDVDIDWQAGQEMLIEVLLQAASHDADDYFVFAIERAGVPEDRLGGSHRFRVTASLAGRLFETFLLDVGFRGQESVAAETLRTGDLLAFAGVSSMQVKVLPLELHAAEKLHAYTRLYDGARPSTRTKDLIDIVLIASLFRLDAAALRESIADTFTTRDTHALPAALPAPPTAWATPYRRIAGEVGVPAGLASGHAEASALLTPILAEEILTGAWDPDRRSWRG